MGARTVIGVAMFFISMSSAWGSSSYRAMKDCGTAKVVSGDTCSNVKVELAFAGCALHSDPQLAKRVVCEGTKIKARYQDADYRYEATFNKVADGWGGVEWEPIGTVKQWERKKAVSAPVAHLSAEPEAPVERSPAAAAPPAIIPAVPAGSSVPNAVPTPIKVSGFFDFRYTLFSAPRDPLVANAHSESGFGLEDGALYANYDKDKVAIVVDIAFRRGKTVDVEPSNTTAPNQSNTNSFGVGVDRSQLYVRYKALDNLIIDFGQFDTIFGAEMNDSKDRIFGKTGLVFDAAIPNTHTGLMVEYTNSGAYAKALAANPNNKGSYATSATNDQNTEYGMAIGYANEMLRSQVGYMVRPIGKASGLGQGNRSLLDVTAGTTLGRFTLDVEFAMVSDSSKNTLTASDTSDSEKAGTAIFALGTYKIVDPLLVGIRYEHLADDPGSWGVTSGIRSADSYGLSIHYKVTSELELRSEYVAYKYKDVAGTKWDDSRFNVATVVTF